MFNCKQHLRRTVAYFQTDLFYLHRAPPLLSLSHPLSLSVSLSLSLSLAQLPPPSSPPPRSLCCTRCRAVHVHRMTSLWLQLRPTPPFVFNTLLFFLFFFLNLKNPGSSICNLPNCRHNVRRSPAAAVRPLRCRSSCCSLWRIIARNTQQTSPVWGCQTPNYVLGRVAGTHFLTLLGVSVCFRPLDYRCPATRPPDNSECRNLR